jgi:hypothetical protein
MKTNFYYGCTSAAEVQLRFEELSKIYGNQEEVMLVLRNEYSTLMNVLMPSKPAEAEKEEKVTVSDIINSLQAKINPEGLHLEICGSWLWITGKTYLVKDALKELGFRYSKNKLSWYWRSEDNRSGNQEPVPFEMIKEKYGAKEIALSK